MSAGNSDRTGPAVREWDRLARACTFALELHGDQFRKLTEEEDSADRVPYISHLMAVAGLVLVASPMKRVQSQGWDLA